MLHTDNCDGIAELPLQGLWGPQHQTNNVLLDQFTVSLRYLHVGTHVCATRRQINIKGLLSGVCMVQGRQCHKPHVLYRPPHLIGLVFDNSPVSLDKILKVDACSEPYVHLDLFAVRELQQQRGVVWRALHGHEIVLGGLPNLVLVRESLREIASQGLKVLRCSLHPVFETREEEQGILINAHHHTCM